MFLGYIAYKDKITKVVFGLLFFGGLIEFTQYFSSWRDGDLFDFYADFVGIIFGLILILLYKRF